MKILKNSWNLFKKIVNSNNFIIQESSTNRSINISLQKFRERDEILPKFHILSMTLSNLFFQVLNHILILLHFDFLSMNFLFIFRKEIFQSMFIPIGLIIMFFFKLFQFFFQLNFTFILSLDIILKSLMIKHILFISKSNIRIINFNFRLLNLHLIDSIRQFSRLLLIRSEIISHDPFILQLFVFIFL